MIEFIPVPEEYRRVVVERWPITSAWMLARKVKNGYHLFGICKIFLGCLTNGEFHAEKYAIYADNIENNYGNIFSCAIPPTMQTVRLPQYLHGGINPTRVTVNDVIIFECDDMCGTFSQYSYKKVIAAHYMEHKNSLAVIIALLPQPIAEEIADNF